MRGVEEEAERHPVPCGGGGRRRTAARGVQRSNVGRAVAARTLSDEVDDLELTDRVGPPISEREVTAESDKQREAKSDKRSRPAESDKRSRPNREGGGGPRLGWKIREEAGPKLFLELKSNRVKENQF
jgi:hypothetical protein